MELNNLLAQLANHTHYDLPNEIKIAFANQDITTLKKQLGETGVVAHRDMVVSY